MRGADEIMPTFKYDPRGTNESKLRRAEARLTRAWLDAILEINRKVSINRMVGFLAALGLVVLPARPAVRKAPDDDDYQYVMAVFSLAMEKYVETVWQTYNDSVQDTVRFFDGAAKWKPVKFTLTFDEVINDPAVSAMRRNQLEKIVREFVEFNGNPLSVRQTLDIIHREIMAGGFGTREFSALNPRDVARRFKESIGLTHWQMDHVANLRDELLEGRFGAATARGLFRGGDMHRMLDALEDFDTFGSPDSVVGRAGRQAYIERITEKYYNNYRRYRATTQARTEGLRALQQGHEDARAAAMGLGVFDRQDITETWDTSRDARVRDTHSAMQGQIKGSQYPGAYLSPSGAVIMYPCDPNAPAAESINCRCASILEVNYQPSNYAYPG